MEKEKIENKRYYNFNLVIYEDDERFKEQFESIQNEKEAIWIRHDKDIDDEGNLKKSHYHVVLKLKNACTISALAKRINVDDHMIEMVKKSLNGCLKYLIHYGNDDKFQYSKEEVKSNSDTLKRRFEDLVTKDIPEVEKVISIQDYIESCNDYIDFGILGKYVQKINMWDAFRRNMTYFIKLVDSHNGKIASKRYHLDDDFYNNLSGIDL